MALTPKPGTDTSNVTSISQFNQLRAATLPGNDWPVVEILSQGLQERQVTRRNNEVDYVRYNRDYFSVPRSATNADEVYRLSSEGFTFEVWSGLKSIQSNIICKGKPPGLATIVACLLEDGANTIVGHEPSQSLVTLTKEFNQRQSSMNAYDLTIISGLLSTNNAPVKRDPGGKDFKQRLPSKVWDDTGIADLSTGIGYPAYWLASLSVMCSLIKQSVVNPSHTDSMSDTVKRYLEIIESKHRMVKACMEASRVIGWGPRGLD